MTKVPIKNIAIANRGEVAVRIIRACQELGMTSILLHSEPDVDTMAYRMADKTVCIGPALAAQSYLNIEANIQAARLAKADAVHPGFGFLSENRDFADACEKSGLIFIGPSPRVIGVMGDKVQAKKLAQKASVPVLKGYQGDEQEWTQLKYQADQIGYPVLVKASCGGGGKGMRVIHSANEAEAMITSAQRESLNAFANSHVFLEQYLPGAKHIEVQILGDQKGRVIHLFDRECSVQRRHQKIIEESPAPRVSEKMRAQLTQAAVGIAETCQYVGAGTIEFLVQDELFYFLEMNTRLQVEHPVTEMVTGIDLVKAQIQIAMGEAIRYSQDEIRVRGHALECRIYAENPYTGHPSSGRLTYLRWPYGPSRRFDMGFEAGDMITSHYDAMIGKVIVYDESRSAALQRALSVLNGSVVFGVHTNIELLKRILTHQDFRQGFAATDFFQKSFSEPLSSPSIEGESAEQVKELLDQHEGNVFSNQDQFNPWSQKWKTP